jgi:hypothetical protein
MKNKLNSKLTVLAIVLITGLFFVGSLCAQPYGRSPQRGDRMQGGPPFGPPKGLTPVAMVVSPDSKHLYVFHMGMIYQYELPGMKLMTSVEIAKPEKTE